MSATKLRRLQFNAVLETLYPIGNIFISTLSTNPATLLGFGTWSAFAAGKCLVNLDSGQTEFDTVEETGGAKTVTLITANLPSHVHSVDPPNTTSSGQSVDHTHTANTFASYSTMNVSGSQAGGWSGQGTSQTQGASATHTHTIDIPSFTSGSTGGDGAHNNIMPSIVAYMWKRTA